MLDFYACLWPWFAACLAIGAATGALVTRKPTRKGAARWLLWSAAASLAAVAAVALGAALGATLMSIESALACFAAFMTGAAAAAWGLGRGFGAHEGWALGLAPAALLWCGALLWGQPAYEAALQKRVAALAQAAGADPAGLGVAGRDVTATPAAAKNGELMAQIARAPGVRRIVASQEARLGAPQDAAQDARQGAPQEARQGAPQDAAPPPSDTKRDETASIAAPAPVAHDAASDAPPAGDAAVGDDLDAAACQRALDAVATQEPVLFHAGRATVNRRVALALDKAAEVIRRCPDGAIEIRGHGDGAGDDALSHRRARAAERYLRREGVAGRRLEPAGCCESGRRESREEHRAGTIDYILR